MRIELYTVTLRNAAGREREERVVATSDRGASNAALKRVERETGERDWQVARVL